MIRKIAVTVFALLVVVGALVGVKALQINAMIESGESMGPPPETVSSAAVREDAWDSTLAAVGSVTAVQGVVLRAELPGTVTRIAFESGARVGTGQLLIQLDTSSEQAQLRAAEAQAELAQLNLRRARDLRAQDLIAQSELDAAQANALRTVGEADAIKAIIAKKTITAPFAGQLGIRQVNLGQFVNAGDPIVSLQSLDPIHVDFTLPEQQLAKLQRGMPVRISSDASPGRVFEGKITAQDPDIDPATRSVRLQATLSNRDGVLRPGMFARVQIVLPGLRTVQVVPATAVLHAPYGDAVFVIGETKDEKSGRVARTVQMTTVRSGETRGDLVEILQGLKPGQEIATSGVFKLRNGMVVNIDNKLAPAPQAAPTPANS